MNRYDLQALSTEELLRLRTHHLKELRRLRRSRYIRGALLFALSALLAALALFMASCTLPQTEVAPPTPPPASPEVMHELGRLHEEMVLLRHEMLGRLEPLTFLTDWMVRLQQVETRVQSLTPKPVVKMGRGRIVEKPVTPVQLVSQAQMDARVVPEAGGFHGGSAEYAYAWTPGKVYTVYLSQAQPTLVTLPPGEQMVSGLLLSGEQYEVKTERAGEGVLAYDAITIRPTVEKGEIDTFILTTSGRRYLLHLTVGKVGMLAVTFEGSAIVSKPETRPQVVLPRPIQ